MYCSQDRHGSLKNFRQARAKEQLATDACEGVVRCMRRRLRLPSGGFGTRYKNNTDQRIRVFTI